jgi:hypothetical protein
MDQAPGVLLAEPRVPRPRPAPRLRLLTELEPRHRVFFGNLADLLLARRVPQAPITSRPAAFWHDVFVPSGISWIAFLESMIWHVLVLTLFVWGQSRVWEPVKLFPERETVHRTITYYPPPTPTHTFQASQSRAAAVRPRVRHTPTPAAVHSAVHQAPMPVTPEQKPRMVTPPDIKEATAKLPNVLSSHAVTPMPPLSATAELQRKGLAGPSEVVAPPPQVDKATARQLALPQAAAVAPAPEVVAGSAGRIVKSPNSVQIVPPPPSVQSAGSSREGRLSSLSGGPNVVPAPPSVSRAGDAAGDRRLRSLAGAGSQVVPPAPSVQTGNSNGSARLSSLSDARPNVVLPPPSVPGDAAGARLGSMAGTGSQVIAPPPSVQSAGGPAGRTRAALGGVGSEVVAPAPSVEGTGNAGRGGRLASLSGDSAPVLAPHAPGAVAGNNGGGGTGKILEPMDPLTVDASSAASSAMTAGNENQSSVEELPLGFLGVVFAAPGTSFFSNFEVFVAKRRIGKDLQLIKLVYEFLPYQRRLSEYDLNNLPPRVIKLRVIPDPSCDEALGHIIQPPTEAASTGTESPKIPAALRSFDPNTVLSCYRTTATDFQKAMSGGR